MTDVVRVVAYPRVHVGFRMIAPEADRLFGSIGFSVSPPIIKVQVRPAPTLRCAHDRAHAFARSTLDLLDVPGAAIDVEESLPAHSGFGSGTQLALATYAGIACVYGREPRPREIAPALGRGQRSGVGIATFERGGFVVDDGHPRSSVLESDATGDRWSAPPLLERRAIPESWRVLLVLPDAPSGKSGTAEAQSIQDAITSAAGATSQVIDPILFDQVLPALEHDDVAAFGAGIERIDAINGDWFAAQQGARYRPPCDRVIASLTEADSIYGAGQSSWGPLVYGISTADEEAAARRAGEDALDSADVTGRVWLAAPQNAGAQTIDFDECITTVDGGHDREIT